jgi:hypothetical protein
MLFIYIIDAPFCMSVDQWGIADEPISKLFARSCWQLYSTVTCHGGIPSAYCLVYMLLNLVSVLCRNWRGTATLKDQVKQHGDQVGDGRFLAVAVC